MKYYAALDVSMKEICMCIVNEEGKKVYEVFVPSKPKAVHEALNQSGFLPAKIGLESGSTSSYLTKGLRALGYNVVCIDARKMAAILSVTVNKTDKNDARGIADALRCNHYKETHIKRDEDESVSILLKSRATLIHNRNLLKNTIRGHLKLYGICLGSVSHKNFPNMVRSHFPKILPEAEKGIEALLQAYEVCDRQINALEKPIQELCKKDEQVRLLMTVPGVGPIVALTFKTDLGDPSRFKKSSSVGAYYGMTPKQYSSGEQKRQGHISKCGASAVRTLLNEAALVLLTRCTQWSTLKAWGLQIMKKHGLKKACMAVARQLSVILHRMLITGEAFRYSHIKP